jgi:predicted DNA-binding protein with PD1-like motif
MPATALTLGRTFGVTFNDGDDFFTELRAVCRDNDIRGAYIPMFIAGLSEARIVGACDKLDDPAAPVWSAVYLTNVEALGGGTLAWDPDNGEIAPHIHITVGEKERSATGHTSHLLDAKVQFLTEMIIQEVAAPAMQRIRQPDMYNVPLLRFGTEA